MQTGRDQQRVAVSQERSGFSRKVKSALGLRQEISTTIDSNSGITMLLKWIELQTCNHLSSTRANKTIPHRPKQCEVSKQNDTQIQSFPAVFLQLISKLRPKSTVISAN